MKNIYRLIFVLFLAAVSRTAMASEIRTDSMGSLSLAASDDESDYELRFLRMTFLLLAFSASIPFWCKNGILLLGGELILIPVIVRVLYLAFMAFFESLFNQTFHFFLELGFVVVPLMGAILFLAGQIQIFRMIRKGLKNPKIIKFRKNTIKIIGPHYERVINRKLVLIHMID